MTNDNDGIGATGKFPEGKLNGTNDEGELRFAIGTRPDGVIVLDFNKPVAWLGMSRADALALAKGLAKAAGAKKIVITL